MGELSELQGQTQGETLETVYEKFNIDHLVQKFLNKWTIFLFCSILFSSNQKEH